MRMWRLLVIYLSSLACLSAQGYPAGSSEGFSSQLLKRSVPISLHVPAPAVLASWKAAHPGVQARVVLMLPGAYDGPADLIRHGIYAHVAQEEAAGRIAPALWVSITHFGSWYADRKDGSFPFETFLVRELLPDIEKRFPGFGGSRESRSIAGLSMGGFGALNLCGRTDLFSRCVALSPALVEPPFGQAGWFMRHSLQRAFPLTPEAFTPWNPWKHLGGTADLFLGCGTEDKYGLAPVTRDFAQLCARRNRTVSLELRPGGHDWKYWAPEFKRLAEWLHGGTAPLPAPALKTQQSVKTL